MADPPRPAQVPPRTEAGSTPMPRWVKLSVIVALLAIALLVAMLLAGGHGPGRHSPNSGTSPGVSGGGHAPPVGGHG
ncbi:hypothetical protein [Micromonospora sp. CPCC 206061]|uniref:hypothetical protein n=1 Tax=Micromonospora sp. CPCC 206061 TaxID=3122410 RepID=UPI002FEEE828